MSDTFRNPGRKGLKRGVLRPQVNKDGYIYVQAPPGHPYTTKRGAILEHRLVMEMTLGRFLVPGEIVHHINGVKTDNRPDNLELTNRVAHARDPDHLKHKECRFCGSEYLGAPSRVFCSMSCRERAEYQRNKASMIAKQSQKWREKRVGKDRRCPTCGAALGELHGNRKYCSASCSPWS